MKVRVLFSTAMIGAMAAGLMAQAPVMRTFDYDDAQPQATIEPADASWTAPTPGETPAASRGLVFGTPAFDYGQVKEGEIVRGAFEFTNTSGIPVRVVEIRSSCGCTATKEDERRVYEPGESGTINAEFNTRGFQGRQIKTVTVVTDEPPNGQNYVVRLQGSIVRDVYVSELQVQFGTVPKGEAVSHTFHLVNMSGREEILREVRSTDNNLFIAVGDAEEFVEPATGQTGERIPITVTIPAETPVSTLASNVRVRVDYDPVPEFAVNVRARVVGPVQVDPEQTFYGILYPGDASERQHTLTLTNGGVFQMSEWTVEPASEDAAWTAETLGLDVSVAAPEGEAETQAMRVTAKAPERAGRYDGKLVLTGTANDQTMTVEVPFRMFVRARPAGSATSSGN